MKIYKMTKIKSHKYPLHYFFDWWGQPCKEHHPGCSRCVSEVEYKKNPIKASFKAKELLSKWENT